MQTICEYLKHEIDPAKDWDYLRLDVRIAMIVGDSASIMFDTIYRKVKYQSNLTYDGRNWIQMSYKEWQAVLMTFSYSTIRRSVSKLRDLGLIDTMVRNQKEEDSRLCITVNEDALTKLLKGGKYNI